MCKTFIKALLFLLLWGTVHAISPQFPVSFWNFSPTPPPTPIRWWDASILGLANGATVSTITERIGGTPAGLLGSGTAPAYQTYSLNGLSTILFVNTACYYSTAYTCNFPVTVAAVVNIRSAVSTGTESAILGPTTAGYPMFACYKDAGGGFTLSIAKSFVANVAVSTSTFSGDAWHLLVWQISSSAWALYVDGASVGSGSNALGAFNGGVIIGSQQNGLFSNMDGQLGMLLVYDSILGASDLTSLHRFGQIRWGTP